MSTDPDAIVVGAGPNGLAAAARLARAGLRVLVLEAADRPGGAAWTVESTLPGFHHDVGAGFVAFKDSAAFVGLDLEARGLRFGLGELESAHPAPDGTCPAVARDVDRAAPTFGPDADAWRDLHTFHARIDPELLAYLAPFPQIAPAWRMGPKDGFRLLGAFMSSSAGFARRTFTTEAARRVIPSMGLHVDVGPDDRFGMPICWMLTMRATTAGFAVPMGGMASVSRAMIAEIDAHGGQVRTGARVERIVVHRRRAVGVVLRGGEQIDVGRFVLADTSAPALYLGLLERAQVPGFVHRAMRRFRWGWGTFKLDFALDGPVPWSAPDAARSAVVHVADSVDDLARFTAQVRAGELPDRPYLVVGQQSLVDPSRAPPGKHTLYAYTHVPSALDPARYPGGWPAWRERLADVVQARIEGLAPGFSHRVLLRSVQDPEDLERMDGNLVGGDLGGGSNAWYRQLVFRPVFPYFRYRTSVPNVYLCSSFAHPGAGVHGMCGWNAAGIALAS